MAPSGRLFYLVLLPLTVTLISLALLLGILGNPFSSSTLGSRRARFERYRRDAVYRVGPGEQGEPYVVPKGPSEPEGGVNAHASNLVPINRAIKDFRHQSCKDYGRIDRLPLATVIIPFGQQVKSLLLRTVSSVVNRSPPQFLAEVLVVTHGNITNSLYSNASNALGKELARLWPDEGVRLVEAGDLAGVYEARQVGMQHSRGEVLVFMEPHCEVEDGWLEPLLYRLTHSPLTMVAPVLDRIDPETLEHTETLSDQIAGFRWNLTLLWQPLSDREKATRSSPAEPIKTPAISSAVFAVSTVFLTGVRGFQPLMYTAQIELELAFRVWMCGGSVEIIPCSRVAHLDHGHQYDEGNVARREKAQMQVAEVWMDEYRRLFYMYRKEILSRSYGGDFALPQLAASREKCLGFAWYLQNVYPEKFMPDENVYSWGVVRNPWSKKCLSIRDQHRHITGEVHITTCDHTGNMDQTYSYTFSQTIRQEEKCMDSEGLEGSVVRMVDCHNAGNSSHWQYNKEDCVVKHVQSGLCLDAGDDAGTRPAQLAPCNGGKDHQVWTFLYYLV